MKSKTALRLATYWPPYLIAGVKVLSFNDDLSKVRVGLKMHFWNKNFFGTHFGGSLYSMCDPFFALMLIHKLGNEYVVWDKAAEITFLKAVSHPVHVDFEISDSEIEDIKQKTLDEFKVEPVFNTYVVDDKGEKIALLKKTIYVRRKDAKERFSRNQ